MPYEAQIKLSREKNYQLNICLSIEYCLKVKTSIVGDS